jgi:hypothetical protein
MTEGVHAGVCCDPLGETLGEGGVEDVAAMRGAGQQGVVRPLGRGRQHQVLARLQVWKLLLGEASGQPAAQWRAVAEEAASELIRRVKASGFAYKVGGIKIRFRGFETHTWEKTLVSRTDSLEALFDVVDSLLDEFAMAGRPVRLVGVRVADLAATSSEPKRLDEWSAIG